MVKAILSSPIGRKFVATTMFATAVLSANAVNIKNNETNESIIQAEFVSKEAASALKTRVIDSSMKSLDRNKKIDKLLLDTCKKGRETKEVKSSMDVVYNSFGVNAATVKLQRDLDDYYMEKTIDSYLEYYDFTTKELNIANQVISHFYGWKDNVFYNEMYKSEAKMFNKKADLSTEECINIVDSHLKNEEFFTQDDADLYKEFSKIFLSKQTDKTSQQSKLDLLAYKTHLLNALAFNRYFVTNVLPHSYIFTSVFSYDFIYGEGVVKP